ncbi:MULTISPECIES: bis(5'-nucleosyl)-tetraphosphatase (symmetrical) YqeK [unclassified Lactobacillus]|uniref:bis(5'-nucleosyl)-tetraphosphatase (symmetrical) YqeK n=1 Tax=unclassified Lactobacillus TaxID=2620435 RepID=UPI000EFC5FD9|nr:MULTISPECIES: bis(5'-nucleosyl)-tetraphosphatase (symmetrical) YqeK [unclassified Lactobacillus]RMC39138.1 HD domain-containing protein [Lactobacillus sp. ESL0237]RMC43421.1 HD domain-containing protein [Lactobacillus sp. ESL0234]RMC44333.1 HD domain-containing protein [Lactobacillus sp. ESL0236]RMC46770.1 HD domain-containing protein [Lactobacillus sp. ESL0230]RMC49433.1 HD domain-containing protein [Lactobacillus sp. ESL0225]
MSDLFFENTYSPLSSNEIITKEKNNMDQSRFNHCVRVSETARKLAKLNHYDENKAALTGFVHDYAKQIPADEFRKVIKEQKMDHDLLNWGPAIWHGMVGAYFVQRDLKIIDSEILNAIKRHTTADVEMTLLDKIVFMADYIEPGRTFAGVEEAQEVTCNNLDSGVAYQLAHTLEFLIKKRDKIYPRTLDAYNVWSTKENNEEKN